MRREAQRLAIPPNRVICTGDIVAYCANPNETVELVRDWGCHVIKGNCEQQLAELAEDCGCGFDDGTACDLLSARWYAFADNALRDDHRQWMSALPASIDFELGTLTARVIHGGVRDVSRFVFPSTANDVKQAEIDSAAADILIAGHCGIPFVEKFGTRVWFNPGVIGMPANDATPDGWYGLITPQPETGTAVFSLRRLCYDAQAAARRLARLGHVDSYAEALRTGLWPSLDVLPQAERQQTGIPLREIDLTISLDPT